MQCDGDPMKHQEVDDEYIDRALASADLNALRLALIQATGDSSLAELDIELAPVRGGAFFLPTLSPEGGELVKKRAKEFLRSPETPDRDQLSISDEQISDLVQILTGESIDGPMVNMAREELAFEDFPRESQWTNGERPENAENFHVTVIGAGFSGIALGIKLGRLGIPYTIIERLDELTGTWHRNRYPGVRVDTHCYLYQFKFEKRYKWGEYFPKQEQVKAYLDHLADKHDVRRHVRLGEEVVSAEWDDAASMWRVRSKDSAGNEHDYDTNVVISATGVFSTPRWPDIEGLDRFEGHLVHTADWDPNIDWAGLRIGVIGNGSTGTQIVPALAKHAGHVTAFQRTPQWIINSPMLGAKISAEEHWLIDTMPYYWNWLGFVQFIGTAQTQVAQIIDPEWQAAGGLINERNDRLREGLIAYLDSKVGDDQFLLENSIPDYAPLARRIVIDNGWFDALKLPHVNLEVRNIAEVVPEGVRLADGHVVPLDMLVLATGYQVSNYFHPVEYRGREGTTFESAWSKDGARAYLGLTMPNFPNFYAMYGPNATPRFGGFPQWVDVWSRYILDLVVTQIEGEYRSVECRQQVFDEYNRRMDDATKELLWESEGGGSYFVNEFGRSGLQMPWSADVYHSWVRKPRADDFEWRP